jgi:hypothetical protein
MASSSFDRQKQSAEENWARLVDQLGEIIQWQTWRSDAGPFFDANSPWVKREFIDRLSHANEWTFGRIWPEGHEKLKSAIDAFGQLLADWTHQFGKHMESPGPDSPFHLYVTTERFYHIADWDPTRYDRLVNEYEYHVRFLADLALEATRYGNYIIRLVRDEIDPSFRFNEGLLLLKISAGIFQYQLIRPEFGPSDFNNGEPYRDLETFKRERSQRDIHFEGSGYYFDA